MDELKRIEQQARETLRAMSKMTTMRGEYAFEGIPKEGSADFESFLRGFVLAKCWEYERLRNAGANNG